MPDPTPCPAHLMGDQRLIWEIFEAQKVLAIQKNIDYGSSFAKAPAFAPHLDPCDAILVRMSDKLERIRTLRGKNPAVASESLSDTMRDLGTYAFLWVIAQQRAAATAAPTTVQLADGWTRTEIPVPGGGVALAYKRDREVIQSTSDIDLAELADEDAGKSYIVPPGVDHPDARAEIGLVADDRDPTDDMGEAVSHIVTDHRVLLADLPPHPCAYDLDDEVGSVTQKLEYCAPPDQPTSQKRWYLMPGYRTDFPEHMFARKSDGTYLYIYRDAIPNGRMSASAMIAPKPCAYGDASGEGVRTIPGLVVSPGGGLGVVPPPPGGPLYTPLAQMPNGCYEVELIHGASTVPRMMKIEAGVIKHAGRIYEPGEIMARVMGPFDTKISEVDRWDSSPHALVRTAYGLVGVRLHEGNHIRINGTTIHPDAILESYPQGHICRFWYISECHSAWMMRFGERHKQDPYSATGQSNTTPIVDDAP